MKFVCHGEKWHFGSIGPLRLFDFVQTVFTKGVIIGIDMANGGGK